MTLEEIDRTILEALRVGVVAAGYLPDVANFLNNPTGYEAAKAAIRTGPPAKQIIDVFGVGAPDARIEKSVCKFVIDRTGFVKGGLGGFPVTVFTKTYTNPNQTGPQDPYTAVKEMLPGQSKNIRYTVRLISQSAIYDRIMIDIIENVLGSRAYFKCVNNSGAFVGDNILLDQENFVDVTSTDLIERLYSYIIPDVWIERSKVVTAGVVPMSTIEAIYYPEWQIDDTITDTQTIN